MGTEDYAIGSIADLISGKTTPGKPKVVQKVFEKQSPKTPIGSKKSPKKAKVKTPGSAKKQLNVSSEKKAQKSTPRSKQKLSESVDDETTSEQKFTPRGKRKSSENKETEQKTTPRSKRKLSENAEVEAEEEIEPPKKKQNKGLNEKQKAKEKSENMKIFADRTLFVGNVPLALSKAALKKFFSKYGAVESLRIRGVPVADVRVPKKVAFIKKEFHPKRTSVLCYVR